MTARPSPAVSVVIPHYNQAALLEKCLESLQDQSLSGDQYEIIVADNGTPGGIDPIKARYANVSFVHASERGAAPARNAALKVARGDAIAFIDADCIADRDWLCAGIEGLGEADLSGGRIVVTCKDERTLSPVEAFERVFAFRQKTYIEKKRFSATANLLVRRAAAEAIGPFTNGLSEDVDWCRRAGALGFRLAFNPKSIVSHPARRDWSELIRKWERITAERWAGFHRTGVFGAVRWTLLAGATALSTAPHLLQVMTSAELNSARDRLAAASVLARIRWWRARRMAALLTAK